MPKTIKLSELPLVETVSDDMVLMVVSEGNNHKIRVKDLIHGAYWECEHCNTLTSLDRCPSCGAPRKRPK